MAKPKSNRFATISLVTNPQNPFTLEGYDNFETDGTWVSFQWKNDAGDKMIKDIAIPVSQIAILVQELIDDEEELSDGN